ncbi:MAG: hypothetical protein ABI967_08235 [bacterium]
MGNSSEAKSKQPAGRSLIDRVVDATSDETLSELEDREQDSSATATGIDAGPSPDGALDDPDELKDAGPK